MVYRSRTSRWGPRWFCLGSGFIRSPHRIRFRPSHGVYRHPLTSFYERRFRVPLEKSSRRITHNMIQPIGAIADERAQCVCSNRFISTDATGRWPRSTVQQDGTAAAQRPLVGYPAHRTCQQVSNPPRKTSALHREHDGVCPGSGAAGSCAGAFPDYWRRFIFSWLLLLPLVLPKSA